jgi:ankyrin repeat protein
VTPLLEVADGGEGSLAIARVLIAHGADVNIRTSNSWGLFGCHSGRTPLKEAAWSMRGDRVEMIQLLLENGAQVNQEFCDNKTPLYWAKRRDSQESADLLIS